MKTQLKGISFSVFLLSLTLFFAACSSDSSSNQNKGTTDANSTENVQNVAASPLGGSDCNRPLDIHLSNASFQSKNNYQLTYTWNSADNATAYEFAFYLNGTTAFQNATVTDTFITFTTNIPSQDTMHASVTTVCGPKKSDSAKESSKATYLNAIGVDDVVFLVDPSKSVSDICSRTSCEKLKFTGTSLLNSNGTTINITSFQGLIYYLDFNTVKNCIQCSGGTAPVVDPVAFNNCLSNPLNQYWMYDPNAYTSCP